MVKIHFTTIVWRRWGQAFFETYPTLGIHSISFYKWKNIIDYILQSKIKFKEKDRKIYNSTILIPNIRSYWLNNDSYFLNNDLSLNKDKLQLPPFL